MAYISLNQRRWGILILVLFIVYWFVPINLNHEIPIIQISSMSLVYCGSGNILLFMDGGENMGDMLLPKLISA